MAESSPVGRVHTEAVRGAEGLPAGLESSQWHKHSRGLISVPVRLVCSVPGPPIAAHAFGGVYQLRKVKELKVTQLLSDSQG